MTRLLLACLFCISASASTYYVRLDGDNGNAGTATNTAWRNVWYAAVTAEAGDVVYIGEGEFRESVTNSVSGTAGNLITFAGSRSGAEWLTIIDPSEDLTNWTLADEGSNGVYKCTLTGANPLREVTVGSGRQRLVFVFTPDNIDTEYGIGSVYESSGITTGIEFLSQPADKQLSNHFNVPFPMWSDLGACYASTGNVAYIRFRNGEDPNTMDVRGADTGTDSLSGAAISKAAVMMDGTSYVVWSNVWVRGAASGFQLRTYANNNTIISNKVTGCHGKIYLYGTTTITNAPRQNVIIGNITDGHLYGWTNTGAHNCYPAVSNSTQLAAIRENNYEFCKYLIGQGTEYDLGITLYYVGHSNTVAFNTVSNGWGNGIYLRGNPNCPFADTLVFSNTVANFPSVGCLLYGGMTNARIFGNVFSDCNACFRTVEPSADSTDTNTTIYIYRNRCYNPNDYGDGVYVFWSVSGGVTVWNTNWWYHNSFSGGYRGIGLGAYFDNNGGTKGHHWLNNIFSGQCLPNYWVSGSSGYGAESDYMGGFDYNLVPTNSASVAWFEENNVQTGANEWVNTLGMSFALQSTSSAIGAAVDIPTTYPALPFIGTKYGSAWDIGALEYQPPQATATTLRVGTMRSAP